MKPGPKPDYKEKAPYKCRKCGGTEYKVYGKDKRRVCIVCNKRNRIESYHRNKEEINRSRSERNIHKGYNRKWHIMRRYRITLEDYEEMLESQDNKCAICGGPPNGSSVTKFCIDHDHESGEVRGLLCNKCNCGLANFRDDRDVLKNAAKYLERAAIKATAPHG